jgi:tetratricopeptide (TPR) repeat protein
MCTKKTLLSKYLGAAIVSTLLFNTAYACLNGELMELKTKFIVWEDRLGNVPYGHIFHSDEYEAEVKVMDSLFHITNDYGYLSDKGLLLILLKRYDEAIDLYLTIEKIQPEKYSTASNLGTAYELIGKNDLALQWIKQAVKINSVSHANSEWIHIKILEAKIKGEQFITTKNLLNVDFGTNEEPNSTLDKNELDKLAKALYFQLNERVSFIKPKDKIIAQLLFDLGNVELLRKHNRDAITDYELAKLYGYEAPLVDKRIEFLRNEVLEKGGRQKRIKLIITASIISGTILLIAFFVINANRKKM